MWAKVSGFEVASDADGDDEDGVDDSAAVVVATVSVLSFDVVAKHLTEEEAEQRSILCPEDKTLKENILLEVKFLLSKKSNSKVNKNVNKRYPPISKRSEK